MPPKPRQHAFDCPGSGQLIDHSPLVQQHQDRYALYAEARRKVGVFLDVYLRDSRFSRQLLGYLSHRRCE
jgi:hypothetical protein